MPSAFCIVVRIGMKVGMNNGRTTDDVRVGKKRNTCMVTDEERRKQKGYYFLYRKHGAKVRNNIKKPSEFFLWSELCFRQYVLVVFIQKKGFERCFVMFHVRIYDLVDKPHGGASRRFARK